MVERREGGGRRPISFRFDDRAAQHFRTKRLLINRFVRDLARSILRGRVIMEIASLSLSYIYIYIYVCTVVESP